MVTNTLAQRIRRPDPTVSRVSAAIYGRGGSGKTSLLKTMPGQGLVIDVPNIEGGTMVLSDVENIDVLEINSWDELQEVYDALRTGMASPISNVPYQWVALDTITALQQLAKGKAIRERTINADPSVVGLQDWGKMGELMSRLFFQFRRLPQHVIFLSQERLKEIADGIYEYQPDISPASLTALLPSQFLVGRLYVVDVETPDGTKQVRRLRVGSNDRFLTKVRAVPGRDLPPVVEDPNLGAIFRWLLGVEGAERPRAAEVGGGMSNPFAAVKE